jgi:holo-[acyl-carrier protein] synthase
VASHLVLRVGTDVESIFEVARSIERFGSRYTDRLYTPHELESCGGRRAGAAPGLTARFAAKEATIKVLRPVGDDVPGWKSIEVRRTPGGWVELALSGRAEEMARAAGLRHLELSLSHSAGVAMATVVAWSETEEG